MRKLLLEWFESLPDGRIDPRFKPGARVLLKPVCEPCQRGLNERFEIPAHPLLKQLLRGQPAELTSHDQRLVARWFLKTAMVLALSRQPDRGPKPPPEWAEQMIRSFLADMIKRDEDPPDSVVRLGAFSLDVGDTRGAFLPAGWAAAGRYLTSQVIVLAGLFAEIVIAAHPTLIRETRFDYRLTRIWPDQQPSVSWPPRIVVSGSDIGRLRGEWTHRLPYGGNWPAIDLG